MQYAHAHTHTHANNNTIQHCFKLMTHPRFDSAVTLCILLNLVVMGLQHYQQPGYVTDIIYYSNLTFLVLFTAGKDTHNTYTTHTRHT